VDAAPPAETVPVDEKAIPIADLAEVIAIDRQIKEHLARIGEIEYTASEQKDEIRGQLAEIRRKQSFEHARLMRQYKIVEGSRIDFETGKVTAP
jgi:carbonic anhydrase